MAYESFPGKRVLAKPYQCKRCFYCPKAAKTETMLGAPPSIGENFIYSFISMRPFVSLGLVGVFMLAFQCGRADQTPDAALSATTLLTREKQQELFGALDLTSDALKPVADAVAAGDYPKAVHELAEYYRHRTSPAWKLTEPRNPAATDPVTVAAVEGRVKGESVPPFHTFTDNKIDWFYNATYNVPGLAPNYGWQEMLCRMDFWVNLANAYRATHDERYVDAWIKQFHSYILECPSPNYDDPGISYGDPATTHPPSGKGLDVGIRLMQSWPISFFSFLPASQFTDQDIALYLDSCLLQVRYLEKHTSAHGNGVTMEMGGLYTFAVYFPEFKESKEWRDYAAKQMRNVEVTQFLPDGMESELSTMYDNLEIDNLLNIADLANGVGRLNELPEGYIADLEKAFYFDLYIMTPNRKDPEFNDSASYGLASQFALALKYFPDNQEFQWGATDGAQGHAPAETSHEFPYAGFYVMRSGWEKDANYFVLRAGPMGENHSHQDKLNVILWPYGRELLFNTGGATYETSKWRVFSTSSFSKNTILVDDKGQERNSKNFQGIFSKTPINARWESTPDHDFAAGVYDDGYGSLNYHPATHTRRVLFVKPDLFVVADTLVPNDAAEHSYQARWNLLTTKTQEDPVTHAVTTLDENLPNMVLLPLQPDHLEVRSVSAQEEPELLGWCIRHDANLPHMPATTVLHTKKGSGVQNFLTLLVPMRAGTASPIKSVQSQGPDSATVTFNDGRSFRIAAGPAPADGIEVTETLPTGGAGRHIKVAAAAPSPSNTARN